MNDVARKETESGEIAQPVSSSQPARWRQQGMFDDMERMFDRLQSLFPYARRWGMPPWLEEWAGRMQPPAVDIIERDTEVVVRAAVPGVKKEELELSLTEDTITLKGRVAREEREEKAEYCRSEIFRGDFSRTVGLPAAVDAEQAKASFQDGMLEVVVPKKQPVARKTIPIE